MWAFLARVTLPLHILCVNEGDNVSTVLKTELT